MNVKPGTSRIFIAMMAVVLLAAGCNRSSNDTPSAAAKTDAVTAANAKSSDSSGGGAYGSGSSGTSSSAGTSASSDTSSRSSAAASKAEMTIEDSVITTKVKTALMADPDIKSTDISVETSKGEVTLRGSVRSQPQMSQATKIARDVEGVKDVNNKLSIKKS